MTRGLNHWSWIAAAVLAGVVAAGCRGATQPAANGAAANQVTATWIKAFDSGDAKALAALYADDARSTPPGTAVLNGRDSIEAYWRDDIGVPGAVTTKLTPGDSIAQGDLLHVTGDYVVTPKSGVAVAKGQYQQLWRRVDDQWKIQHEIWRLDPVLQRDTTSASQLESRWTAAYNAGDAAALTALYDEDAVLSTRPSGSVTGRDAIAEFWKEDFGSGKPTTKLTLADVYMAGDLMHLEGEYDVVDKGKTTKGHYVQLWMQDGNYWRIHREMWWQ